jgi:AraC family transcriptional regulator, positive regulator of tynA and feaB
MSETAVSDRPRRRDGCADESALPRAGGLERWSVRGADAGTRLDAWSKILATTHLSFDVRPTRRTPDCFRGAVTRRAVGDLMLVDCAAVPFSASRSDRIIGTTPGGAREDVLGFQFVGRGVEMVREEGREFAVRSGDIVLWDGTQPTEIEVVEEFSKRTMLFPRDRVLEVCPRLGSVEVLPSLAGSATARLLARYMNALALEQPALDEVAGSAAMSAALELLRAAIEPSLPADRGAARAAMRAEITRYVRRHLQDPGLAPASIARAYAMSVRSLFSLFEDVDESPARLIRNERLARCLEDLRQPNGGSVTEIAFRWGFGDAAHFSRVFKREYGISPREARQAARLEPALG